MAQLGGPGALAAMFYIYIFLGPVIGQNNFLRVVLHCHPQKLLAKIKSSPNKTLDFAVSKKQVKGPAQ